MLRISFIKFGSTLKCLILCSSLVGGGIALAQDKKQGDAKPEQKTAKPGGRDPFGQPPFIRKTGPKPVVVPKDTKPKVAVRPTPPPPSLVKAPEIEDRVNFYKEQKQAYIAEGKMPPKPTTIFKIDEIEISGIFRTPRGYAAMVQAKPINLSYVIYPGEQLYDGQLVAIDEDQVVFRHHLQWSDGRTESKIERKALRQAATYDPLTEEKKVPAAAQPATPEQPAASPVAAETPAAVPAKPKANPGSYANVLMNSLPTRGNETDTSKPAPEFSEAPAAATPKPAPASGNKKAPAKGKKPAAKNAKPAQKP